MDQNSTASDKPEQAKSFWRRLQWSPWGMLIMLPVFLLLGHGSLRSLAAGSGIALLGAGEITLVKRAYRRLGNVPSVRLLYAGGCVTTGCVSMLAGWWLARRPIDWMTLGGQLIMSSVILGPIMYSKDLTGQIEPKDGK